jgi:oligopeptide transport system ATP-binding protein
MNENETLLEVHNLKKYFATRKSFLSSKKRILKAVDDVSFSVKRGETLGLVGESGCGKTTLGKTVIYLEQPTSGKVLFEGRDLGEADKEELRKERLKLQIVFQDPYGSLNARMSVGAMLQEPLLYHGLYSKQDSQDRVVELLKMVGLRPFHAHRYPHEFSGGQRQRIAIARALAVNPTFVVCDEPVSALDVSVQSQVLNLFADLREQLNLTYMFISHDLTVVRHISDRVGVMYLGKIVELADRNELYHSPLHPYTRALLAAMPVPKSGARLKRSILQGDLPSPIDIPPGCRFCDRCPSAMPVCSELEPDLVDAGGGHLVACHLDRSTT